MKVAALSRRSLRLPAHLPLRVRSGLPVALVLLVWLVGIASPRSAAACGVSTGAGGGVASCSLAEHENRVELPWRVGVATTYTWTALRFTGDQRADAQRSAFLATLEYRATRRLSFLAGLGVLSGGELRTGGVTYDMQVGPLFALGASYRILDPRKSGQPFLLGGAQLSYVASSTRPTSTPLGETPYYASDLRLGLTLGVTLLDRVSPYVTGRVFGGPVYWHLAGASVTGTDIHKYQVGGGLALALGGKNGKGPHLDAFFEGIPLGEQGLTGGFGLSF